MTMKGLNFTGLGDFSSLMSRGYQDYLDLYNKDRGLTVQEKQADYLYPKESPVPMIAAQAVARDPLQLLAQSFQAGRENRPPPTFYSAPVINRVTGQVMTPAQRLPMGPDRNPNSVPEDAPQDGEDVTPPGSRGFGIPDSSAPQTYSGTEPLGAPSAQPDQTDELHSLASQLGLSVKDGQLMAKGKQGEKILDLYEKLITSAASVYGNATRGNGDVHIVRPALSGGGGTGKVKLTPYEEKRVKDIDDEVKDLRDLKKDPVRQYNELRSVQVQGNDGQLKRLQQKDFGSYIDQQIQERKLEQEKIYGGSKVGAVAPGATKPSQVQAAYGSGQNVPASAVRPGATKKRWDKIKKTTTYVYPDGSEVVVDGLK